MKITVLWKGFVIEGAYTAGDPGKLTGPPEHCYPPHPGEFDAETLTVDDWEGVSEWMDICMPHEPWRPTQRTVKIPLDVQRRILDAGVDSFYEEAVEQGEQAALDGYEAAQEDKADAMRERRWLGE